ncbi:MAG: TetR/AcrR family transcriptional regulator, partial [Archangium sp.]|nr:TetR/AcrR family transcriptional regulator [Archangium sp.]
KALPARLQPRRRPAQRRSKALVDAIVEAGSRVLMARGWDRFTMNEVASVAGVSPGSLYQYFPDKESLVAEIVERQSQRELAFHLERFAQLPENATLGDTLDEVVRSLLAFQRAEGSLMRHTLASLQHLGRFESLKDKAQRAGEFLHAVLERHRGALAGRDLDLVAHVLANAVHSLTHDGIFPRPDTLDDDTLATELSRLMRGYLGLNQRSDVSPRTR